MNVSVIIPARNEERRIKKTLEDYSRLDCEIIVVSNSTDKTNEVVKNFKNVMLIESADDGKGAAIIKGFEKAGCSVVGFVDADDSLKPSEFVKLVKEINKGCDCAVGSRWIKGSRLIKKQPALRVITSRAFNLAVRVLFGLGLRDTQCGGKAFKKEALNSVLPIKSKGFEFDVELLWKLKSKGFRIREVPVEWSDSEGSTFSMKNAPLMLFNLLRLKLNV